MLALAGNTSADLVVHWKLDEGSGTIAADASGNGYDGTFVGTPEWADGYHGGGVHFTAEGQIVQYSFAAAEPWPAGTVAVWVKADTMGQGNWNGVFSSHVPNSAGFQMDTNDGDPGNYRFQPGGVVFGVVTTEWVHLAVTWDGTSLNTYYNGVWANSGTVTATNTTFDRFALGVNRSGANTLMGVFDDLQVYDHALSEIEILGAMEGQPWPYAYSPDPADGAIHEATWVSLSWKPGDLAVSHDVYMGDNFGDVNEATRDSDVFRGNQTGDFYVAGFPGFAYPEGLVPGTMYYWRIDEVNEADPNSPWKGDVWSFWVPPRNAYNPGPVDGMKFVDPNVELSWTEGFGAKLHHVYFGDNFDDVSNATGALAQADATYTPGPLELEKVYYWRVDEYDGAITLKGDIWSFTIKPVIPITDPTLIGRWTLDEGMGTTALDWSGHGHDASFRGEPWWVDGYDGGGLAFDGVDDSVVTSFDEETWSAFTVTLWAKAATVGQNEWSSVFANHVPNSAGFQLGVDGSNPGIYRYNGANGGLVEISEVTTSWVHISVTCNGTSTTIYYNGNVAATIGAADPVFNMFGIGINRGGDQSFEGIIDDVRVYDKELTQEEVRLVMRIDPLLAWSASPTNGTTVDIDNATPLTWSRGDMASQHDVYFGTYKDAVANADSSDTTGIYRGSQAGTSFTPSEGIEWGGGPYYWRIDENNTDATVTKGRVWSFTVADFILIDDFESYDANDNQIWYAWHDGLGYGAPDTADFFAGNGTGAAVGDETTASYTEETIVNGGSQSMPLAYDNNKQGFAKYSETELALTAPRDWTKHELAELSLWFRGYLESASTFTEGPSGTYTMTARSGNIWGQTDQLHYLFKQLSGPGSIIAKVESVTNTSTGAKCGVMIREMLTGDSKHAFTFMRPDGGVRFNRRIEVGDTTSNSVENGLEFPRWVKLERDVSGLFTASHSADGVTWVPVDDINMGTSSSVQMNSVVYIGVALSSNNTAETCEAVLSNIQVTGATTGEWQSQDIGILANAAEPLYVALADAAGTPAVVYHDDANAATIDIWTEWIIPLQAFADQGINLADVDRIAIGLGTRGNMTTPGGSGKTFLDDIRLYRTRDIEAE